MEMSQADFLNTITNVLGLSVKQREVLYDEKYDMISTIIHWKYGEIREWRTTNSNLTTTRGGDSFGDQKSSAYGCWYGGPPILPSGVNILS